MSRTYGLADTARGTENGDVLVGDSRRREEASAGSSGTKAVAKGRADHLGRRQGKGYSESEVGRGKQGWRLVKKGDRRDGRQVTGGSLRLAKAVSIRARDLLLSGWVLRPAGRASGVVAFGLGRTRAAGRNDRTGTGTATATATASPQHAQYDVCKPQPLAMKWNT